MYNNLLNYFEKILDDEALRLSYVIKAKYKKDDEELFSLNEILKKISKPEFTFYSSIIEIKILKYLPKDYTEDYDDMFNVNEIKEAYYQKYANGKKEFGLMDIEKIAYNLFNLIKKQQNTNADLFTYISMLIKKMKLYNLCFDSMDARVTVYFLDKLINKKKQCIKTYNPLILQSKKEK